MTAFLIMHRQEITDPAKLREYRKGVGDTIARHGGKVLVRQDGFEVLEGDWEPGRRGDDSEPERVTVIQFPDMAALKDWYDSDDYEPFRKIRTASSIADVIAVDGAIHKDE
jgi:uncharacterized protein (DUF1330 family)